MSSRPRFADDVVPWFAARPFRSREIEMNQLNSDELETVQGLEQLSLGPVEEEPKRKRGGQPGNRGVRGRGGRGSGPGSRGGRGRRGGAVSLTKEPHGVEAQEPTSSGSGAPPQQPKTSARGGRGRGRGRGARASEKVVEVEEEESDVLPALGPAEAREAREARANRRSQRSNDVATTRKGTNKE